MYSVPQSEQLTIFVSALGFGFLLGIFYDILRALRLSITKSKIAVIIFDIIYFLMFGFLTFLFTLALNKGEVRFYIIAGELIGALFYYFSFGIAVIKITDRFISLLRKFYSFVFRIISAPFRLIKKAFSAFFRKTAKIFKKTEKKSDKMRKKLLPKAWLYVYNLLGILLANKPIFRKDGRDFGKGKESEKAN